MNATELESALADLRNLLDGPLQETGVAPAKIGVLGTEWIIIASLDYNSRPEVEALRLDKFLEVWRQARKLWEDGGGEFGDGDETMSERLIEGYYECERAELT